MKLTAYPARVREDATALVVLIGEPSRAVTWELDGDGMLEALTTWTDAQGRAYATYTPGAVGATPVVRAIYGA